MVHFACKCFHLLKLLAFATMGTKCFLLLMTESSDKINSFFEHPRPDMLKDSRFLSNQFAAGTKKAGMRKATYTCRPQTTPRMGQLDDPYMNERSITDESSFVNKNIWTEFGQFWTNSHYRWSMDANGYSTKAASQAAEVHFISVFVGAALLICNQQVTGSSPVAGSI